jgi:DNA-binding GntR family transcriptional regulator
MSTHVEESWPVPETMVDGITERLRQAIITGAIRPRERIRVADLERKFGVSHIPIREALRRLQSEGFVEISPRRTTIAAGVDLNDLAHIYDLRRIIEIEIGRRSVSSMTKKDVEAVRLALEGFQGTAGARGKFHGQTCSRPSLAKLGTLCAPVRVHLRDHGHGHGPSRRALRSVRRR